MDTPDESAASPEPLEPWITIWTRPRATVRWLVENHPERNLLLLAALGGITQVLDRAVWRSLGDRLPLLTILGFAVVGGIITGIAAMYLGSALLRWTGSWLGGKASPEEVRTAVAWANVPLVVALALWIPELALFGKELFTSATPQIDSSPALLAALIVFGLLDLTLAVWAVVIFVTGLSEVQGFSVWKAAGNAALTLVVILLPIAAVALLVAVLSWP